ncbi:topoisomerase DNA-binding C4 zinc finger domain-containing protein [Dinoroseobacter sp. PD6]|nr:MULTISPECIES: topoisomerase DNA-binding C4 zinc finger domain-containing protein [Dinoroseobacter]MDD9717788.1 topoisomerase DNA-binding C4 zinc finger domain-containing protein [Dinoroseobacter sp. PD6]URF48605.1 topoisomerase DNA-binding C4 zinc finger domain-containing protein [Dinoroseobacter shibae]URF52917.1 topoisomerase DNA-binding C4 zinc finger domain-containing protein [Dinoroseobacter shibae]
MPAYPACGVGLPVRSRTNGDLICGDCDESQRACPSCEAGWLVERCGRYEAFLGCVRFPDCDGKAKLRQIA